MYLFSLLSFASLIAQKFFNFLTSSSSITSTWGKPQYLLLVANWQPKMANDVLASVVSWLSWKWQCNDIIMSQQNDFLIKITKKCEVGQHFSFFVSESYDGCVSFAHNMWLLILLIYFYFCNIFKFWLIATTKNTYHDSLFWQSCEQGLRGSHFSHYFLMTLFCIFY